MKALAEQMSVYAAYHNDATNKAIHFVFVPLIIWSAMGLLVQLGNWQVGALGVTAAHVIALVLLAYYLSLDFPLGVAMVFLFTLMLVTVLQVQSTLGPGAWMLFMAVFVGSWIAQLVGHAAFEHRKPALADNVLQVFVAPIFVVAEWAFAIGLRRQLHDEVRRGMVAHLPKPGAQG
ncbi:MAG TPA: Mpo1-like protein [Candidatus Thermoplasmatota archaeon]|nr:Mpo1-like protein [Candidatus Thermoplasmatota archaeon]